MSLPNGAILDNRYRILELLGEGGMGSVYKAENQRMPGPLWAIKELLIEAFADPRELREAVDRFEKESTLMGQLTILPHPRLPRVIDRFTENGRYYFVMEFVPGKSLDRMLDEAKAPLPERQVVEWAIQVCEALSFIHSQTPPVILRDLKPGNIMITPQGEVKLIDFGIARIWKPGQKSNTENLGTMTYASPEHLGQTGQTDARSDIYSLGATMFHLLTNEEPTPLDTPLPGSMHGRNPAISQRVEEVVIKAMQLDPNRRFQSASAMQTALQSCLSAPVAANHHQASVNHAPAAPAAPSPGSTLVVPVDAKICPFCGYMNRSTAKFCKVDGKPLPNDNLSMASAVQSARRSAAAGNPALNAAPAPAAARASVNPNTRRADALYDQGLREYNNGRYQQALTCIREALQLDQPTYARLYKLGETYRRLSQLADAIATFQKAANLRPGYDVYFQIGLAQRDMKQYSAAVAAFTQARKFEPQNPAIACQLGILAMEQNDYMIAERELRNGLQLQSRHYLLRYSLGQLFNREQRWDEAITELQEAVQLSPNQAEAWHELGKAFFGARRYPDAVKALEQARAQGLASADVYRLSAQSYEKISNRKQAKEFAKKALLLNPNDADARRLAR
ncbi:MAG TPA: serine/threonine-protein kinase [Ktedonobacterales bacterium]|nr:serine/threonine-protein kinase [Ktedonobacterales bacterium]